MKSVVKFAPSVLPQLQAAQAKLRSQAKPVAAVINRPLKAAAPVRAFRVRDLAPGALPPVQAILQRLKFSKKTAAPGLTRTVPAIQEDMTSTMPTSSTAVAEATTPWTPIHQPPRLHEQHWMEYSKNTHTE